MADDLGKLLYRADLSRAELARRLGISPNTISRWHGTAPQYAAAYLRLLAAVREAGR